MQSEAAPAFGVRLLAAALASMIYKIGVAKAAASNRTPKRRMVAAEQVREVSLDKLSAPQPAA